MGIREQVTAKLALPVREVVEESLARHPFVRPGEIDDLRDAIRAAAPGTGDAERLERLDGEIAQLRAQLADGTGRVAALPAALVELRATIDAARTATAAATELAARAARTAEAAADRITELEERTP